MPLSSKLIWEMTQSKDLRIIPPKEKEWVFAYQFSFVTGWGLVPGALISWCFWLATHAGRSDSGLWTGGDVDARS